VTERNRKCLLQKDGLNLSGRRGIRKRADCKRVICIDLPLALLQQTYVSLV
jgi:hypothetical protein